MTQPKTFSGKWYPGMPSFEDPLDEMEWLDNYEYHNPTGERTEEDEIGEIAKYLPSGHTVNNSLLVDAARRALDGISTAQEEANRLSSKKIIIKKGN